MSLHYHFSLLAPPVPVICWNLQLLFCSVFCDRCIEYHMLVGLSREYWLSRLLEPHLSHFRVGPLFCDFYILIVFEILSLCSVTLCITLVIVNHCGIDVLFVILWLFLCYLSILECKSYMINAIFCFKQFLLRTLSKKGKLSCYCVCCKIRFFVCLISNNMHNCVLCWTCVKEAWNGRMAFCRYPAS